MASFSEIIANVSVWNKFSTWSYLHIKEVCNDSDLLFCYRGVLGHAGPAQPNERDGHQGKLFIPRLKAGRGTFSKRLLQEVVLGLQLDNEVAAVQVLLVLLQMSGEKSPKKKTQQ